MGLGVDSLRLAPYHQVLETDAATQLLLQSDL